MRRIAKVIGLFLGFVFAWAYWTTIKHAYAHFEIRDYSLKTDGTLWGEPAIMGLELLNQNGTNLAFARMNHPDRYVSILHPDFGDCGELERAAPFSSSKRQQWQLCSQAHAKWVGSWMNDVRAVNVRLASCSIPNVPVVTKAHRHMWWLFWVPNPHLDNTLSTSYHITISFDGARCVSVNK